MCQPCNHMERVTQKPQLLKQTLYKHRIFQYIWVFMYVVHVLYMRATPYKAKTREMQNSSFAKLEQFRTIQGKNSRNANLDFCQTRDLVGNLDRKENEVTDFFIDFGQSRYSSTFDRMVRVYNNVTYYCDLIQCRAHCIRRRWLKVALWKRICCRRYRIIGLTQPEI